MPDDYRGASRQIVRELGSTATRCWKIQWAGAAARRQHLCREGIHAVGVDRLVSEARVTRATFYRHFTGKADLVRAYIEREDSALREMFETVEAGTTDPNEILELVIQGFAADVDQHHARGCPFINVAAEFPDPA